MRMERLTAAGSVALLLVAGVAVPVAAVLGIGKEEGGGHGHLEGSGFSALVGTATLIATVATLLRDVVLPLTYPKWNSLAGESLQCDVKQRKMVAQFVALLIRLDCFLVLLTVWQSFTWEHGLEFSSSDPMAERAYLVARVWLAALLIWELAFIPGLMWDDWAHHVLTLFACVVTVDTSCGAGWWSPYGRAAGFCYFFGASVASLNYVLLLGFHIHTGAPARQAYFIGGSALFSAAWQLVLFAVIPIKMVLHGYAKGEVGWPELLIILGASSSMCFIDAKVNLVRWRIMLTKLRQATKTVCGYPTSPTNAPGSPTLRITCYSPRVPENHILHAAG